MAKVWFLAAAVLLAVSTTWPAAAAEKLTPENFTCEKAFGPGYTPHPDYKFSCCWPGFEPIPGKPGCRPIGGGDTPTDAETGDKPAPGGNVRDAEGRPGAPGEHCIPHGGTCTLHGASCCAAGDTCSGKFPNTVCQ